MPATTLDAARVVGIVTPHIDFHRGGHTETASYVPLVKNVEATGKPFDLFIVLGIFMDFTFTAGDFGATYSSVVLV